MERLSIRNAFLALALIVSSINLSLGYAFARGGFAAIEFAFFALQLATPALAFFVGSHYAKRAERVVDALHLMAAGDLSKKLKIEGRDDFSWIAYEFDCARKATVELINLIKVHVQETAQTAAQLSAILDQVASRSGQQSDAASAMAASVEEITVSVNHIADSAREAHDLATESGRASEEGAAVIRRTAEGVRHIAEAARGASERVSMLGRHADQISSIVGVIKDIADQTNLLALNAAIEAARAGEYGRGFTVVADEVRKLAERTGASTQEISETVKTIQSGIAAVVEGMGPWVDQVEKEAELASRTEEAIDRIRESSARVARIVADISHTLGEQASVANDVAQRVEKVAQMAADNGAAVQEADHAAKRFLDLASALRGTAERFRV